MSDWIVKHSLVLGADRRKVYLCWPCSNHGNVSQIPKWSIYLSLWPHGLQPTLLLSPGILQGRTLQWVHIPISRGSSRPRDWTPASRTAGGLFTSWATGKPSVYPWFVFSFICYKLIIYPSLDNISTYPSFIYSFVYHPACHLIVHPSTVSINHLSTLSII